MEIHRAGSDRRRIGRLAKKNAFVSTADMGPQLVLERAVPEDEGRADDSREASAAKALGAELLGLARDRPLARTWRARKDGADVAVVVVAEDATPAERELFARMAEEIHSAGAELAGVLRVRAVAPSREAFLTDLWTTGSARDLSALTWSPRRRVEFVLATVRTLGALHARGIVHGCLCPANILLDDALVPVLAEVGSVPVHALAGRGADGVHYAAFAAPEVLRGEAADARSDVYSVGRVLEEAVKGDDPGAHPALKEIVRRCTAGEPSARYPGAGELGAALEAVAGELPDVDGAATVPAAPVLAPRPVPDRDRPARGEGLTAGPSSGRFAGIASLSAWRPSQAVGFAGIAAVVASIAASAMFGGFSGSVRTVLELALLVGTALATTLARPSEGGGATRALAMMTGLAMASAALMAVLDPLSLTYRLAAQRQLRGDESSRRASIAEIVRLGRDFRGLSLANLDLSGADLAGADLRGVDLSDANLAHAGLFAADVQGASFAGAALGGANLERVELQLASVGAATCDAETHLPQGWRCREQRVARSR
jgi:hypothetical protein